MNDDISNYAKEVTKELAKLFRTVLSGCGYAYILEVYESIPEIMDEDFRKILEKIIEEIKNSYNNEANEEVVEKIFKVSFEKIMKIEDEEKRRSALSKLIPGLGPFLKYGMVDEERLKELIEEIINGNSNSFIKTYLKINVFWLTPLVFKKLRETGIIKIELTPEEILNSKEISDEDRAEIIFYNLDIFVRQVDKYLDNKNKNIENAEELLKGIIKYVPVRQLANERALVSGLNNVVEAGYEINYFATMFYDIIYNAFKKIINEKGKIDDYMLVFLLNFHHPRLILYSKQAIDDFIEWIGREFYKFDEEINSYEVLLNKFFDNLKEKYQDREEDIKEFKFICFVLGNVLKISRNGVDIFVTDQYIRENNKDNILRLLRDILDHSPPLAEEIIERVVEDCQKDNKKAGKLQENLKKLIEMDPELATEWETLIREWNPEILEVEVMN